MTILEYYEELKKHDWYYSFSDDMSKYHQGEIERKRLLRIADHFGDEYKNLYRKFEEHFFSWAAFGTKKRPMPEKPTE